MRSFEDFRSGDFGNTAAFEEPREGITSVTQTEGRTHSALAYNGGFGLVVKNVAVYIKAKVFLEIAFVGGP